MISSSIYLQDIVSAYIDQGFAPIPIRYKSKHRSIPPYFPNSPSRLLLGSCTYVMMSIDPNQKTTATFSVQQYSIQTNQPKRNRRERGHRISAIRCPGF